MYSILTKTNIQNDIVNNVLSYNHKSEIEYFKEWEKKKNEVINNFYYDIFSVIDKKYNSKSRDFYIQACMYNNIFEEGINSMEELYKQKDINKYRNILNSCYVS